MAYPVLFRFQTQLFRNRDAGDNTQVPFENSPVDFYRQGATVALEQVVPPMNKATAWVFDPGDLKKNDVVSVGVAGPQLVADLDPAFPAPFPGVVSLRLRNDSPHAIAVRPQDRLIVLSRRPEVFADPLGTESLGSSHPTTADGHIGVYVAVQRFDYVLRQTVPIGLLGSTIGSVAAGETLSWIHADQPNQNCVLVGFSWNDAGENPADILSVKYGGLDMTLVAREGGAAVYRRWGPLPPLGQNPVEVQFSNLVNAAGGCLSLENVGGFAPLAAFGSDASPTVGLFGLSATGQVLSVLGAVTTTSSPSATPLPPQQETWNASFGAGFQHVRSAGSTRASAVGSVPIDWELSAPANWYLVAVDV